MRQLILLRGTSAIGKSTFIKEKDQLIAVKVIGESLIRISLSLMK